MPTRQDTLTTSKLPAVPHDAEKARRAVTNGNSRKRFFLDSWTISIFLEESEAENVVLLSARFYGGLEGHLGCWASVSAL